MATAEQLATPPAPPIACRTARSYAEPFGPDNVCGGPVAGFALTIRPADVDRLLAGEQPREMYPIAYCAEHLRRLEEAHADIRANGHKPDVAHLFAGQASGVLWLEAR